MKFFGSNYEKSNRMHFSIVEIKFEINFIRTKAQTHDFYHVNSTIVFYFLFKEIGVNRNDYVFQPLRFNQSENVCRENREN